MIELKLTADTPAKLFEEMLALLAGTSAAASLAPNQPAEPAPKRGRAKKDADPTPEPQPEPQPEPGSEAAPDAGTATGGSQSAQTTTAVSGEITKETLTAKCMTLVGKAGPPALAELLGEFGAKKMGEVDPAKYPDVDARLNQLLA